ncbi:hypothetical protein CMI44_00265 [Candidatus Pacearchaeota archaeon]|mgnify:CR=1 FL=1|jgi:hypothetical protein|nr:hypothetical protein [Candidatus Pacearchaeota archaeon]|tara:strand:- start:234 stop:428 length:195 start_codon:yes stop_codon:yes gene_type:complete
MKIILFIIIFLTIGALLIINNDNLFLTNPDNLEEFSSDYLQWFDKIFNNAQKITGEAVNLEWLP